MSLIEFLILLVIAAICGAVGRSIVGAENSGCIVSIVLGFIGALVGSRLSQVLDIPELVVIPIAGRRFPVVWSIIGAALFVALITLLSGRRRRFD